MSIPHYNNPSRKLGEDFGRAHRTKIRSSTVIDENNNEVATTVVFSGASSQDKNMEISRTTTVQRIIPATDDTPEINETEVIEEHTWAKWDDLLTATYYPSDTILSVHFDMGD